MDIKLNQTFQMDNLLAMRKRLPPAQWQEHVAKMFAHIESCGAKKMDGGVSATYAADADGMDMEMYFPIDRVIPSTEEFIFKPKLRLVNCVKMNYKGNPQGLQGAMESVNTYMTDNGLTPVAVGFVVTVREVHDVRDLELFEVDVYVPVNPNVF